MRKKFTLKGWKTGLPDDLFIKAGRALINKHIKEISSACVYELISKYSHINIHIYDSGHIYLKLEIDDFGDAKMVKNINFYGLIADMVANVQEPKELQKIRDSLLSMASEVNEVIEAKQKE